MSLGDCEDGIDEAGWSRAMARDSKPKRKRATAEERIARQHEKLAAIDSQIGRLMTKRVDEEEKLARMLDRLATAPVQVHP